MPETMLDINKRILFLYPYKTTAIVKEIERGEAPSDRLYGFIELRRRKWNVIISDARWSGPLAHLRKKLKNFLEIPNLGTFYDMIHSDVVLVKDDFSLTLSMQAKILHKQIIYLDAMFKLPKGLLRKWAAAINLRLCDKILCYSEQQSKHWTDVFRLPRTYFTVLPYCMDVNFYPQVRRKIEEPPFIFAIGRDVGREYVTLLEVARRLGINLKLVTRPYLLPPNANDSHWLQVYDHIDYAQLFDLYARASVVVVPIKKGITYPSGIRAVLEGIVLGVPTVATSTPVLKEYLDGDDDVLFAEAEDIDSLTKQIKWVLENRTEAEEKAKKASDRIRKRFCMENFANHLISCLNEL
jgi:glycosyltransferase involved in cell wall biosynthesis